MPKTKLKSKVKSQQQALPQAPTLSKKELAAQKRKAANLRRELIGAIGQSLLFAIPFAGLGLAVDGPQAAAGGLLAMMVIVLASKYPRQAIWAFLIYMPFSGTVTYWVGGGSPIFQLAKDGFYIPALIGLYKYCKTERLPLLLPKKLVPWIYLLFAYCILVILLVNTDDPNPRDKPILMGILGLKVLMGYVPLISCAYYTIRSKKEFLFMTRLHLILAIICCGLCLTQYMFLVTGRCAGTRFYSGDELFKANLEAKCLVGGSLNYSPQQNSIRLPGTFVSPWHWGWFMIANAFLTFAVAFSDPSPLWRMGGMGGMAMVFVCSVISGQRVATLLVPIINAIMMVLTGQVANLKRFIPIALGLGAILGGAAVMFPEVIEQRWQSLVSRVGSAPPTAFIEEQFERSTKYADLLGHGLGRATNSARAFGRTKLIETYYPKMIYEIGWPGVILFLLLVTVLTFLAFKAYRSLREKNLRSFGACFWVFILIVSYQTYWYPLDTDPVSVYYWFFAGVIFRLPDIDKQEQKRLAEEAEQGEVSPDKKKLLKYGRKK